MLTLLCHEMDLAVSRLPVTRKDIIVCTVDRDGILIDALWRCARQKYRAFDVVWDRSNVTVYNTQGGFATHFSFESATHVELITDGIDWANAPTFYLEHADLIPDAFLQKCVAPFTDLNNPRHLFAYYTLSGRQPEGYVFPLDSAEYRVACVG